MELVARLHAAGWLPAEEAAATRDMVLRGNPHTLAVLAGAVTVYAEAWARAEGKKGEGEGVGTASGSSASGVGGARAVEPAAAARPACADLVHTLRVVSQSAFMM